MMLRYPDTETFFAGNVFSGSVFRQNKKWKQGFRCPGGIAAHRRIIRKFSDSDGSGQDMAIHFSMTAAEGGKFPSCFVISAGFSERFFYRILQFFLRRMRHFRSEGRGWEQVPSPVHFKAVIPPDHSFICPEPPGGTPENRQLSQVRESRMQGNAHVRFGDMVHEAPPVFPGCDMCYSPHTNFSKSRSGATA